MPKSNLLCIFTIVLKLQLQVHLMVVNMDPNFKNFIEGIIKCFFPAIVAFKEELMVFRRLVIEPVTQEFISLKKGCDHDEVWEVKRDIGDKKNWLSSTQLGTNPKQNFDQVVKKLVLFISNLLWTTRGFSSATFYEQQDYLHTRLKERSNRMNPAEVHCDMRASFVVVELGEEGLAMVGMKKGMLLMLTRKTG